MNILEQHDEHTDELHRCKMLFLASQNKWMKKQIEFFNLLIHKCKEIIKISEDPQKQNISKALREEFNKTVQLKIESYEEVKNTDYFRQQGMENQEFIDIVQSFQVKIIQLQSGIKDCQKQLQEIQYKAGKEDNQKLNRNQSKWPSNITVNVGLLQKVRSQLVRLKQKKKKLQKKMVALTQHHIQSQDDSTSIKPKKQSSASEQSEMSTFEKVSLVFKKQKYQNQVLQQKIKQLQNEIGVKKMISQRVRKESETKEWRCFQAVQAVRNGYIQSRSDYDISVVDKSFCQANMSFSFDVSRFMKPIQRFEPC